MSNLARHYYVIYLQYYHALLCYLTSILSCTIMLSTFNIIMHYYVNYLQHYHTLLCYLSSILSCAIVFSIFNIIIHNFGINTKILKYEFHYPQCFKKLRIYYLQNKRTIRRSKNMVSEDIFFV